ncbi:LuxR family transcriptional regulator [Legionella gratiana]|uniref:LuxR family transcriptional regulator n=1 Tax=Legionella gratiana TaxID=45066 RepID=A0A378J394_9GAMM|nr:PAS and helix-turn-helix domain-containing protein [Legionella gratiana]KTD14557.1 LuxR family transcriptional regulator [Legionella gratiana]STX41856.1 LuxR family transcriptional regulator [Legionella gratiana]
MITRNLLRFMCTNNPVTTDVDDILDTTLANVYLKDKKGLYLDCNHNMSSVIKLQIDDVKGKMDTDLIWREQAHILMRNDAQIIEQNKVKTFIEPVQLEGGPRICYLSRKAPLRMRDGKIIGIMGISFQIDCDTSLLTALQETISLLTSNPNEHVPLPQVPIQNVNNQLTAKQIDCLYYLVKGMTIKQIGQQLNLSPRTVEDHLNAAKNKLHCHNRVELIAAALEIPIIRNQL